MKVLRRLFVVLAAAFCLFTTGCQKGLDDPDTATDHGDSVWVIKTKHEQSFATSNGYPTYVINGNYTYDKQARIIVARDTIDNSFIRYGTFKYDPNGLLVERDLIEGGIKTLNQKIYYNADTSVSKYIVTKELATTPLQGDFHWTKTNTGYLVSYTEPILAIPDMFQGPGNFELNNSGQIIKYYNKYPGTVPFEYEYIRDTKGNLICTKRSHLNNGVVYHAEDSTVITRDFSHPPRLYDFRKLMAKGIHLIDEGGEFGPYLINFRYYYYEGYLPLKTTNYTWVEIPSYEGFILISEDRYTIDYDNNNNPVKITYFLDAEKQCEITFTWEKIKWL